MFFVFSKDKIISYLISLCMVMLLLGIAFYVKTSSNTSYVSSNSIQQNNSNALIEKNK